MSMPTPNRKPKADLVERLKTLQTETFKTALAVLVWGPGQSSPRFYDKRVQIRDAIRTQFVHGSAYLSEDDELKGALKGGGSLTPSQAQEWHIRVCDACVVLDASDGPGEEIARYATGSHQDKFLILVGSERPRAPGSFPSSVREQLDTVHYTQEQFDRCDLRAIVLGKLSTRALLKKIRSA